MPLFKPGVPSAAVYSLHHTQWPSVHRVHIQGSKKSKILGYHILIIQVTGAHGDILIHAYSIPWSNSKFSLLVFTLNPFPISCNQYSTFELTLFLFNLKTFGKYSSVLSMYSFFPCQFSKKYSITSVYIAATLYSVL